MSDRRIGSIVFERHDDCEAGDEVVQFLRHHRYRLFRIRRGFLKTTVVELGGRLEKTLPDTPDYVAVLEDSIFETRLQRLAEG